MKEMISAFFREGTESCGINVNYVKNNVFLKTKH